MKIVFATNNDHKIREISQALGKKFDLLSLSEIDLNHEIPENERTLEGNALVKARYIYDRCDHNVFADDTGLEVEALDGEPGVLSARYAGQDKDSEANISKLLKELENKRNRKARFRTVIALILDGVEYLFEGVVTGIIINERRGKEGFGYDSVFCPANEKRTFAEMSLSEKTRISHRALAVEKLARFLSEMK